MNIEEIKRLASSLFLNVPYLAEIKSDLEHVHALDLMNSIFDDPDAPPQLINLLGRAIDEYEDNQGFTGTVDEESILDMVHESAKDLHSAELISDTKLSEFDALCLTNIMNNKKI